MFTCSNMLKIARLLVQWYKNLSKDKNDYMDYVATNCHDGNLENSDTKNDNIQDYFDLKLRHPDFSGYPGLMLIILLTKEWRKENQLWVM